MKLAIIESPYAGEVDLNIAYARRCMRNSLLSYGEAPIASHLLYTQDGILQDSLPLERKCGIEAGLAWSHVADLHAFYIDRGWSNGMRAALDFCIRTHQEYEFRSLEGRPLLGPEPNQEQR